MAAIHPWQGWWLWGIILPFMYWLFFLIQESGIPFLTNQYNGCQRYLQRDQAIHLCRCSFSEPWIYPAPVDIQKNGGKPINFPRKRICNRTVSLIYLSINVAFFIFISFFLSILIDLFNSYPPILSILSILSIYPIWPVYPINLTQSDPIQSNLSYLSCLSIDSNLT